MSRLSTALDPGRAGYGAVMAYDEALAARVREHVAGEPVMERKMFGGLAFLLNGHLSVSASGRGGLLVRVDPADSDALLTEPGVGLMEMRGRAPMPGWLHVAPEAVEDDAELERWVERGLDYARSLPPKR
jgi:TfoX/Sxy family transcriptional regulator of competence genes